VQKRFFGHISRYDDESKRRIEERNLALGSAAKKMSSSQVDSIPVAGTGTGNTSSSEVQTNSPTEKPKTLEEHDKEKPDVKILSTETKAALTVYVSIIGSVIGTIKWGLITKNWVPFAFLAEILGSLARRRGW
jgi:hypothetical protein